MSQEKQTIAIVGGGLAGVSCALYLAEQENIQIDLYIKESLSESSSFLAQGGIACVISEKDSVQSHIEDTLAAGRDFCNKEAVTFLASNAKQAIDQLVDWQVQFDKNTTGKLILAKEGGHSFKRVLHSGGDASGKMIIQPLLQLAAQNPKIHFHSHSSVYSLYLEKGVVRGLYCQQEGSPIEREYNQVILATGGAGNVYPYTSNPAVSCGDGLIISYLAGAKLSNLEFFQFHPTCLNLEGHRSFLISETVRGAGAILRNSQGEAFMEKYEPKQKDLAPRDIVSQAIHKEQQANQSIFLDVSTIEKNKFTRMFPTIAAYCKTNKIDITQPLPIAPAAHYMVGGIACDLQGRTHVPGLYVCGEAACNGIHGANRLASNSLLEAVVFSKQTALACIKDKENTPSLWQEKPLLQAAKSLPETPILPLAEIQSLMWENVGIIRNQTNLENLLQSFGTITFEEKPTVTSFQNNIILLLAKLITQMAYNRKESRGTHFREDYPNTDINPSWSVTSWQDEV